VYRVISCARLLILKRADKQNDYTANGGGAMDRIMVSETTLSEFRVSPPVDPAGRTFDVHKFGRQ